MVVDPGRWQTLWLLKEIPVLLQEPVQERMLGLRGRHGQLKRGRGCGPPNALPPNATTQTPEGHR